MGEEHYSWILIFDPEKDKSAIPLDYLSQNGFHIITAHDFDSAIAEVRTKKIAVVIAVNQSENTAPLEFLEKMMLEIPYIQRFLISDYIDENLLHIAVNKAHINFFLKLPAKNVIIAKTIREAVRRYYYISKPYQKMDQLVGITMDLVVDVEKYHQQANLDALTDVLNRRSFDSFLKRKIDIYKKKKIIFTLAMIDIDKFKTVNDDFGHKAGDYILKKIASIIQNSTRSGEDLVFRYGGEEFALISTGSDENEIKKILERSLKIVRKTVFKYDKNKIKITFSAGIKTMENKLSAEDIIKKADKAMYFAKSHGRNQIICYNDIK